MESFIPQDVTGRSLFFIGSFYLIVIIVFWKTNIANIDKSKKSQPLLVLLMLFHLIYAFEGGDYFHYYEGVTTNMLSDGQEPIYHWLARVAGNNYVIWRLIVWGGALFIYMQTSKRFGFDQYKIAFLLYVMYFTLFDYARASLGMAIYFFGLSFWCKPLKNKRMLSYAVLAPIIMFGSTFFHSSMYLACAASIFVFMPINKKIIVIAVLFLGLSSTLLNTVFTNIVGMIISSDSSFFTEKVEEYSLQQAEFGGSKFEELRRYIEYATFFIPMLSITFHIFRKKTIGCQQIAIIRLYKVTMAIMLISVSMLIVSTSIILFYRILYISMLGVVLLFYYFRREHIISKTFFNIVVILCLLQVFFNYSKRILGGNIPW